MCLEATPKQYLKVPKDIRDVEKVAHLKKKIYIFTETRSGNVNELN